MGMATAASDGGYRPDRRPRGGNGPPRSIAVTRGGAVLGNRSALAPCIACPARIVARAGTMEERRRLLAGSALAIAARSGYEGGVSRPPAASPAIRSPPVTSGPETARSRASSHQNALGAHWRRLFHSQLIEEG